MPEPSLSATDLIAWVDHTAQHWKRLLAAYPEALTISCDIAGVKSVGELLQHIVAVQLRYAQSLSSLPQTPYEQIPFSTLDEIYATHERSLQLYRDLFAQPGIDWSQTIEFPTRSLGRLASTRSGIVFHSLLHAIRHYAQLATLVRQHGIKPDWQMDYLMMVARPADA
jgi:uncharacterized damage-inducible protein DinB